MQGSLSDSVSLTNPVVTSDPSTLPGSSSAPTEPPRGGPPARLCCFPPQSSLVLASVRSQPGLGGAESCGARMDNHPGVKPTLRCNERHGRGEAKGPLEVWRRECSQSSQPSLFPHRLCTPQGLSHHQTMESGTRSRQSMKTHTHTHISLLETQCPKLCSFILTFTCRASPAE